MQETINADDQPSRVVSNANRRLLSLPRRLHLRKLKFREALVRSIRALRKGAGTGLPAFLLDSKLHRRFLGRASVSPFSIPTLKMLSGLLLGPPVYWFDYVEAL
jgi:hypothetical protein